MGEDPVILQVDINAECQDWGLELLRRGQCWQIWGNENV